MKNKKRIIEIILSIIMVGMLFTYNNYKNVHYNGGTAKQETEQSIISESPKEANQQKVISATCINLYDEYAGDDCLTELYKEENVFARLQCFNQKLNENENYYEVSFQALQSFKYFSLDENFVKIYNREGGKIENQLVNIEGEKCYVTSLNTIQVNKNFNDKFLSSMGIGDVFTEEDFILRDLNKIPIIMGDNYRKHFTIGDTVELNYLGTNYIFYIKGFLAQNAKLRKDDETFYLDNYICIPNFQFYSADPVRENNENFIFLMRYYLQNNCGFFQYETPDEAKKIAKKIGKLAEEYNLDYSFIYNSFVFECINNFVSN